MLRTAFSQLIKVTSSNYTILEHLKISTIFFQAGPLSGRLLSTSAARMSGHGETDEQFDARFEAYFNRPDIDGWQVRKGMNDILGMDLVPEPKIISAGLQACRRVNDFALAIRWLEGVKEKCGPQVGQIYPYLLSEIRPTLDSLGINTPEELGYDKPEMGLKTVDEM